MLPLLAQSTRVLFDPRDPATGPFPTDFLTVSDASEPTGRRVAMPLPADCRQNASLCGELGLVNQLNGFSLTPRLRVRFSGPVRTETLREGLRILPAGAAQPNAEAIPINEVVYDPQTNTAYAQPDWQLEAGTSYLLVATDAVLDAAGQPVGADAGFTACLNRQVGGDYCAAVSEGLTAAQRLLPRGQVVGASRFTTLDPYGFLSSARQSLLPVSFRRAAPRAVFAASDIGTLTLRNQVDLEGRFEDFTLPLLPGLLPQIGVGRIVFGSYASPRYLSQQQVILPGAVATRTEDIQVHAILPATPPPPGGYPVVIIGHGLSNNRFDVSSATLPTYMAAGVAVVAINAVGHGYGPESRVRITERNGTATELPAGGRGVDLDGNGQISSTEGCVIFTPGAPLGLRDCVRQTAVDLMQLVRVIRSGVDLDGDGTVDLNPQGIHYHGVSLGGFYGALLLAHEPDVRAGVLNSAGGSAIEAARLSPSLRLLLTFYLATSTPPVLNAGTGFNENLPRRFEPVRVNTVPGAVEVQNRLDLLRWIEMPAAPQAHAALLRGTDSRARRRVLFQYAIGDQIVPNPTEAALVRAANALDLTSVYRHDLARAAVSNLPANSHGYSFDILGSSAAGVIALAAQSQAARFLLAPDDAYAIPDANAQVRQLFGFDLFEQPPAFLGDELGFLR